MTTKDYSAHDKGTLIRLLKKTDPSSYASQHIRLELINRYQAECETDNISPITAEDDSELESHFDHDGCDICRQGGAEVYETNGYSSKDDKIYSTGQVCNQCCCILANGIDE